MCVYVQRTFVPVRSNAEIDVMTCDDLRWRKEQLGQDSEEMTSGWQGNKNKKNHEQKTKRGPGKTQELSGTSHRTHTTHLDRVWLAGKSASQKQNLIVDDCQSLQK